MVASIKREQGPQPGDLAVPILTKPGEVAQVDFGDVGKLWDPKRQKIRKAYVFVMTLSYSRHMFATIVFDQKVDTWLWLHGQAFAFFGGVPHVVVPDNLKSAVIRAAFDVRTEPVLNQSYRDFARHCRFKIDPTPPYNPEKKGKVENSVKYVKGNFLKTNGEERDVDVLNTELKRWTLEIASLRCQGTTHRKSLEDFGSESRHACSRCRRRSGRTRRDGPARSIEMRVCLSTRPGTRCPGGSSAVSCVHSSASPACRSTGRTPAWRHTHACPPEKTASCWRICLRSEENRGDGIGATGSGAPN